VSLPKSPEAHAINFIFGRYAFDLSLVLAAAMCRAAIKGIWRNRSLQFWRVIDNTFA
jgi:hypothetical protein